MDSPVSLVTFIPLIAAAIMGLFLRGDDEAARRAATKHQRPLRRGVRHGRRGRRRLALRADAPVDLGQCR